MSRTAPPFARILNLVVDIEPHEIKAVALAFACNFVLLGSYYILRPLRDTMATVFGADQLQNLYTGTFVFTFLCAPLFSAVAARTKLTKFLPGLFWFWFANILLFYLLFETGPQNRWVAAAYFWWFSVMNLFIISVFWTFMADIFSDHQATRLFAFIAAGGSTGAIAGPIITTSLVTVIGPGGLLLIAAAGFLLVIAFIYSLVAEKAKFRKLSDEAQKTTLDHALPGNPFRGFKLLFASRFLTGQAMFMLLMTWVATIVYFLQTDYIAKAYTGVDSRTQAFADIDLLVNLASAAILIFGSGRLVQRFGVTAGLVLSPVLMFVCFVVMAFSPTLFLVQTARGIQRVSQYAIARPSREILFTVVDQQSKYKAKNVIDTVVYRFGDVTAAWLQAGVRMAGFGLAGVVTLGIFCSAGWGFIAAAQGRRYEALRNEAQ